MILLGDCLERLKELPDNSVDSVVTDPPYGLKFMGKKWDYDVPSVDMWREVLRVLKPGGHALIACGTRTQHRMVLNIEDAGFEIRDVVTWMYGSGFPKSMNVSIAIDKQSGAMKHRGRSIPTAGRGERVDLQDAPSGWTEPNEHDPITDAAKQWQGWGTALKPACEFWTLARKPISEKTVAANVLKWGVGGLNIDASRIELTGHVDSRILKQEPGGKDASTKFGQIKSSAVTGSLNGRWPANLILDEVAAEMLDEQSGERKGFSGGGTKGAGYRSEYVNGENKNKELPAQYFNDSGGASRFFYVAKASKRERNAGLEGMPVSARDLDGDTGKSSFASEFDEATWKKVNANHHPTVKPIKLMQYLIRLITPPGGVVLDPFCGSGSTLVAAKSLGFESIGIEMNEEYKVIAEKRVQAVGL